MSAPDQSGPSIPLFRTGWVCPQEARDVRKLLADNDICFYETPPTPGNYRSCSASIWTRNPDHAEKAIRLIKDYQLTMQHEARERARQERRQGGSAPGVGKRLTYLLALIGFLAILLGPVWLAVSTT